MQHQGLTIELQLILTESSNIMLSRKFGKEKDSAKIQHNSRASVLKS